MERERSYRSARFCRLSPDAKIMLQFNVSPSHFIPHHHFTGTFHTPDLSFFTSREGRLAGGGEEGGGARGRGWEDESLSFLLDKCQKRTGESVGGGVTDRSLACSSCE